jgi:uncharacterized protein YaaW (UPF0174 family)
VKFQVHEEHFKLVVGKLSSLVALKNKIQEIFFFKNGKRIQIEHMAYLDSCIDIPDDSHETTYKKYWVKLKDDMDVQSLFRSVENENKPHRLYPISLKYLKS